LNFIKFTLAKRDHFRPLLHTNTYMLHPHGYLKGFIDELRSEGRYSFSLAEVRANYKQSDEAIKKALQRLKSKKEIAIIRKEFFAIIPPEYRSRGMLPPSLFIAELMNFLAREYYVGLLNAAAYYGAAHQQPQGFSVITSKPSLRGIHTKTLTLDFFVKKEWSKEDITQMKVESGYINVSSPELTALDIIFFFNEVGGFNRITTVLEELSERMDAQKLVAAAKRFYQITTIQRLGFLLYEVLQNRALSEPLAEYLKTLNYFPVLLRPEKKKLQSMATSNEWKVVQNVQIEADL
jgi:predicted transcriptional regulator of viral defense system